MHLCQARDKGSLSRDEAKQAGHRLLFSCLLFQVMMKMALLRKLESKAPSLSPAGAADNVGSSAQPRRPATEVEVHSGLHPLHKRRDRLRQRWRLPCSALPQRAPGRSLKLLHSSFSQSQWRLFSILCPFRQVFDIFACRLRWNSRTTTSPTTRLSGSGSRPPVVGSKRSTWEFESGA